jgi:hypothetical protein
LRNPGSCLLNDLKIKLLHGVDPHAIINFSLMIDKLEMRFPAT